MGQKISGFAIASLVLGISGFLLLPVLIFFFTNSYGLPEQLLELLILTCIVVVAVFINPLAKPTAIPFACFLVSPIVCSLLAIVLGFIARSKIRENPQEYSGIGLAVLGIFFGFAYFGFIMLFLILISAGVIHVHMGSW